MCGVGRPDAMHVRFYPFETLSSDCWVQTAGAVAGPVPETRVHTDPPTVVAYIPFTVPTGPAAGSASDPACVRTIRAWQLTASRRRTLNVVGELGVTYSPTAGQPARSPQALGYGLASTYTEPDPVRVAETVLYPSVAAFVWDAVQRYVPAPEA